MKISMVLTWIADSLSWLIPCLFSVLFSTVSITQVRKQTHMQNEESERNNKFLEIQVAMQAEADLKTEMFIRAQNDFQRTQISIDLLKPRLRIYHGFSNLFMSVLGGSCTDNEVLSRFWAETEGIEFFLGPELKEYQKQVQEAFLHLQLVKKQQERESAKQNEAERLNLIDKEENYKEQLLNLLQQQSQQFQPFFDFTSTCQQFERPKPDVK